MEAARKIEYMLEVYDISRKELSEAFQIPADICLDISDKLWKDDQKTSSKEWYLISHQKMLQGDKSVNADGMKMVGIFFGDFSPC